MRIIVTEYPKSGGSWLVSMLGTMLDLPCRDVYIGNGYDRFNVAQHPWYRGEPDFNLTDSCVIKSHELPNSPWISFAAQFVHLVRDGRDVIVSKYFYEKDFCVLNGIYDHFDIAFDDYVPLVAKEWRDYVFAWLDANVPIYTYEDLLRAPADTLRKLLAELGYAVSPEQAIAAVQAHTKEKFSRAFDNTFRYNTFVRKASSGDWRNYFTAEHVAVFKQIAGDALLRLGYEADSDWSVGEPIYAPTHSTNEAHGFGEHRAELAYSPRNNNGEPRDMAIQCWCGNTHLTYFSPHYLRCPICETLVTAQMPAPEFTAVRDDEQDFYGREYWFSHQEDDLGQANILERARADMPERALHWLRALLKYKLPPAQTLELGSAHGGFVALMRWAGFDARGLELSPWVVDFARKTFDVPMLLGPIEEQHIAPGSLDAIALMDVLEHLPDPLGTMRHCLSLLKPDGVLLIQTPRYAERRSYDDMVSQHDPFLIQLKHEQHLYLFSEQSIRELFRRLGAEHLVLEQAIFRHYDMFVAVSRAPLVETTPEARTRQLLTTTNGRVMLALLDQDDSKRELGRRLAEAEADRTARLAVIERQGAELGRVPALEADIAFLKEQLRISEADRAARLAVIERQAAELGRMSDRLAFVEQLMSTRVGKLLRTIRPTWWWRLRTALREATALSHRNGDKQPANGPGADYSLDEYIAEIDRFNSAQPNMELLNAIRAYNHSTLDEFNKLRSLRGKRLLDIGASPHGYALEHALQLGVAEYIGIGLDVDQPVEVQAGARVGRLLRMDATQLSLDDEHFDLVVSLSTFEHISDVPAALEEIWRVLKPGGSALISFEPVWTCSYGHHLHHFGPVSKLMPDWAHLIWDKQQMLRELAPIWPTDAPLSLEDAAHWVYESSAINRVGIAQLRDYFTNSNLTVEWMAPNPDAERDPQRLGEVAAAVSLSPDDLMTKGLSVFLNKV